MGRSKAEKAKAHKRIVAIIRGLTASLASRMVINVPDELTSLPGGSRPNRKLCPRTDSQRRWPEVSFEEVAT